MPSKLITDRQKSAKAVATAGETNAKVIGDMFKQRYLAYLNKGEKMPDVELIIHLCARALRADADQMVATDAAHSTELRDDDAPREQRAALTTSVRQLLITIRGGIASGYGPAAEKNAGFSGEIPSDPVVLVEYATGVKEALAKLKLGKALLDGINLSPKTLATQLAPLITSLKGSIEDVAREAREAQVTLAAKNDSTDRYDATFMATARLIEAALLIAGKPALAERVRPSARRPGTTAGSDEPSTTTPAAAAAPLEEPPATSDKPEPAATEEESEPQSQAAAAGGAKKRAKSKRK